MNSFLLVAVPLFILVGHFMERGRVAERIFDFAEAMVGWMPGDVNVVSSVIFGGISGIVRCRHRVCRRDRDQSYGSGMASPRVTRSE